VFKGVASYPVSGMIIENHRNISDNIAGLQAEILNLRHCKCEALALTT
jgi:hypothetical protein